MVWRCHIGVDWENDATRAAWDFLRPHLASAEGYVFSRREYVPSWLPDEKVSIIPPSIDPFSPKNQDLDAATVQAILAKLGVLDGAAPTAPATFVRRNGDAGTVTRPAVITGEGRPGPEIRCCSRSPAGTGSRTWPGSCAASPTTSCPAVTDT